MLSGYSEKISKMREMYNVLRRKVELQERENQEKLRSVIVEKN